MKAPNEKDKSLQIEQIRMTQLRVYLVGATPMIMHRYASKAWRELLLPAATKNKAERAETLKHDPLGEFRECCYRNRDPERPTLMHYPAGAFSKAIASAALDIPGASKAQLLRLVSLMSTQVDVYGVPSLGMDMVRNSDIARKPDVRTRAYFEEWCCAIELEYVSNLITKTQIMNLVGAAGTIVGLGDYRPQKGGQFGKFHIAEENDPNVTRIMKTQGRAAQEAAYMNPSFFSEDSAELYGWFVDELERREKIAPSSLHTTSLPPLDEPGTFAAANAARRNKNSGKGAEA